MSKEKDMFEENLERKEVESVPYIVYESAQARHERNSKRMLIALVISIVMLFVSNLVWLYAWFSYDYESEIITVESTADGDAYYNAQGNDGSIIYGKGYSAETQAN